jgi:hypothetical protein
MAGRVDAPADLGTVSAERVELRWLLQNLGPGRRVGAVSEKSFAWRQTGLVRRHKRAVGTPPISRGACSGGKFAVSRAGKANYVLVGGPNRKFRLQRLPPQLEGNDGRAEEDGEAAHDARGLRA